MIVGKSYQRLILRRNFQYFKFSGSKKQSFPISLSAQRALIAYFALTYIKDFDSNSYIRSTFSIRQDLLSRTIMNSFISKTISEHLKKTKISLNQPIQIWLKQNLSQGSYDEVLKGFDIFKGVQFDGILWRIFYSRRVEQQLKDEQISKGIKYNQQKWQKHYIHWFKQVDVAYLNPTYITKKCFENILSPQNLILSCKSGRGMTTSLLTYFILSNEIIKFRSQQLTKQLQQILDKDEFQHTPMICFINLSQIRNFHTFFMKIYPQFHQIYDKTQIQARFKLDPNQKNKIINKTKTQLRKLLNVISERAKCKKILVKCVFEEGETILYLLSNLQKLISQKQQWKKTDTFRRLRFLGDLISLIIEEEDNKFNNIIFLSNKIFKSFSKTFDPELRKQLKIIDILTTKNIFQNKNMHQVQQKGATLTYNLQFYNIYWFQTLSFLNSYALRFHKKSFLSSQNDYAQYKQYFKKAFSLDKINSLTTLKDLQRWSSQITFFDIHYKINHLSSQRAMHQIRSLICSINSSSQNVRQKQFIQLIKSIKKSIEQRKYENLRKILFQFFYDTNRTQEKRERFVILQQFEKQIYDKSLPKNPQNKHQTFFQYKCQSMSIDLKQKLVTMIGFGEVKQDKNTLILFISPTILLHLLQSIKNNSKYVQMSITYIDFQWSKGIINKNDILALDKALNSFNYLLPITQISIIIRYIADYHGQSINKYKQINFTSVRPYNLFHELALHNDDKENGILKQQNLVIYSFDHIFETATLIFKQQCLQFGYVGGYPVKLFENQQQNCMIYENNFGFDKIAVRQIDGSKFDLILFNITMGTVQSKLNRESIEIIKSFFTRLNITNDVDCTVIYMIPQYHYSVFLQEKENFSNLLQPFEIKNQVSKAEVNVKVNIEVAYFNNKLPFQFPNQKNAKGVILNSIKHFGNIYDKIQEEKNSI